NPTPGKVPYPFQRLRQLIESVPGQVSKANSPDPRSVPVLIALGRSLQRFAADPHYFKFPRLILAADIESRNSHWPSLAGKLFVAFAEPANQLEIISFNETFGRFEFQIVRDYARDQKPQIYYAHRDAC